MGSDDDISADAGSSALPPPPSPPPPPPPPPPGPVVLPLAETTTSVVQRGRGAWVLGVAVVAAVAVGAAALLISRTSDPDPDAALAAAQRVVVEAESFRFEMRTTRHVQVGDPDGAGSDTTTRSVTTGEVAGADRWHVVDDPGDFFGDDFGPFETIRLGAVVYEKGWTDPFPGVTAPAWTESPAALYDLTVEDLAELYSDDPFDMEDAGLDVDDVFLGEQRLELALAGYLVQLGDGDPSGLLRLVSEAEDPAVEEVLADGGLRLRARLAAVPEIQEVADEPLPPVDLLLDLDAERRPTLARFTAAVEGASSEVEIRFSDWGAPISITPPAEGDVDQTPWVQEEALATVPELLIAPAATPADLAVVGVRVYQFDGEDCPSVDVEYGTEAQYGFDLEEMSVEDMQALWDTEPYLSVSSSPEACAESWDSSPFDETFGGFPARGADGSWEVVVGDAWVTISSSLPDDEIEPLVASLRVVPVDSLLDEIPGWATEGW